MLQRNLCWIIFIRNYFVRTHIHLFLHDVGLNQRGDSQINLLFKRRDFNNIFSMFFLDIWGFVFEQNFTCIRHSFSTKTICARNPSPESALLCTLVNYWLYLQEMTCWSTALPLLLLHVSLDSIQDFNFNFGFQTSKASEYPTSLWECQKHLDMVQKIVFGPVWKTLAFPEWYRIFKILIGKSEV